MPLGTRHRARFGMGLLMVIIMLSVVAMVAATIALRAQRSMQAGVAGSRNVSGEDTAYSGLQVALAGVSTSGDDWAAIPGKISMPQRAEQAYRLIVNSNFDNEDPLIDPDGTEIPGESIYVKSLSYNENELVQGMAAVVAQQRGMTFNYPAFGAEGIEMANSQVRAVETDGSPAAEDAPIRVNAQDADSIVLSANSFVDGDITVGPGGDPLIALRAETGSGFSGEADSAGAALPLPEVPATYDGTLSVEPICIPLPLPIPGMPLSFINMTILIIPAGSYDEIHIHPSDTVRLTPEFARLSMLTFGEGNIYCNSLVTSGDEMVEVHATGTSIVHVRDNISFQAASTVMTGSSPDALQIYQTEEAGTVELQNTLGAFVLAAQAEVDISQSAVIGAVYGKKISLTDTSVIYPKALDGKVLNDKIRGNWRLFGSRALTPTEAAQADASP